jgi:hypothetical protein
MERLENERARIEKENEGLDIANTEGILPGGGMILMEYPPSRRPTWAAASACNTNANTPKTSAKASPRCPRSAASAPAT